MVCTTPCHTRGPFKRAIVLIICIHWHPQVHYHCNIYPLHVHLNDLDPLKIPEKLAHLMSSQHFKKMQTELQYVCIMDLTVVVGDYNVWKRISHERPASMLPGCTGRRFKPLRAAMTTRFALSLSMPLQMLSKMANDDRMCEL